MSEEMLKSVRQFFSGIGQKGSPAAVVSCFADDVTYDVFIAQEKPLTFNFQGRRLVEDYCTMIKSTYKVLLSTPTTLVVDGDNVLARGSEIARVVRQNQIVRAEWIAVFEIEDGLIKKIWMSVYRWSILSTDRSPSVDAGWSTGLAQA